MENLIIYSRGNDVPWELLREILNFHHIDHEHIIVEDSIDNLKMQCQIRGESLTFNDFDMMLSTISQEYDQRSGKNYSKRRIKKTQLLNLSSEFLSELKTTKSYEFISTESVPYDQK